MSIPGIAQLVGLPILFLAMILAFIRLVRGPSLPDRVVALELMTMLSVGAAAVYAIASGQMVFLDVAMVLAVLSFLGTVAFSYYIERRKT